MGKVLNLKDRLLILYHKEGMSLREIGKAIGRSHEWVRDILGDDVTPRNKVKNPEKVYKFYLKNGAKKTSEKFYICESYVYKIKLDFERNKK